ncbi:MAG: DNA repair exonuclease [Pirellulales bacterium]
MSHLTTSRVVFLHTADWQIGKPFAFVKDPAKRASLQARRLESIRDLGEVARARGAQFVVVAGDAFDSPRVTKSTISEACGAIGSIGLPVILIPGNHDHAGEGCLWDQQFFLKEREQLAPNLLVLTRCQPLELDQAVILPCPLLRRHEAGDPTEWLRSSDLEAESCSGKVRIVIAHGSVMDFGRRTEPDEAGGLVNFIDLDRLPKNQIDYIALGDWHGTKQVSQNAWYSGTPESDRFPKGIDHEMGNVLIVEASRGSEPKVDVVNVGGIQWHELDLTLPDGSSAADVSSELTTRVGVRTSKDVLRINLRGILGLEQCAELDSLMESFSSRVIHLDLENEIRPTPNDDELQQLTRRAGDRA